MNLFTVRICLLYESAYCHTTHALVLTFSWCAKCSFLSFSIYCQTLFRVLSAGVLCTLWVAGWKPTSNRIKITIGFFYLHKGWLSLHKGHPVNVPIRRTMHLSSVIPANDTRESVFGHRSFPRRERRSNRGKCLTTELPRFPNNTEKPSRCQCIEIMPDPNNFNNKSYLPISPNFSFQLENESRFSLG